MANYTVKNISRSWIYAELDTKDGGGKLEILALGRRKSQTLTQAQWDSKAVQKHIKRNRLRSAQV